METATFDPFNDRLSRTIRNKLSVAFIESLTLMDPAPYRLLAREFLDDGSPPPHLAYVRDRLRRYDSAFEQISRQKMSGAFDQALVLWNQGLFFEVHERLELVFHEAKGAERKAYQGLIKAAGAYIHFARGADASGRKLAVGASALLKEYGHALPSLDTLDTLLERLDTFDTDPPCLRVSKKGV